jgi:phage terminase large subunit
MTTSTHEYEPHGSAREVFFNRDPEVLLSGAAGTGKSRGCLEKMHSMAMLNPGMRGLIVRKTAASLASTGLVTFRQIVAKEALEAGELRWYGGSKSQAPAFIYGNGSEINVGGLDRATRIMSSEYDLIYVQEATELDENDWETLTTRLRNGKVSFQQLMADCNPGPPHHWLNRRSTSGKTTMIYCRHEDNPRLYDSTTSTWTTEGLTYLSKLDALTGVRRKRLRYGKWAAAEGLVYDTFDPDTHLYRLPIHGFPDDWPRYLVVDFGFTNPFVCQWWAQDPDGRLYLYRELYKTRGLVEEHAEVIKKYLQGRPVYDEAGAVLRHDIEPSPLAVICDHDAEDRATLEKHINLPTIAATKTVSDGIQAVEARLKLQEDGRPRLYLCRDALIEKDPLLDEAKKPTCTQDEIYEYVWDPRPQAATGSGQGMGTTMREVPLKANDHGMDCMRYMVAFIDVHKRIKLRWL